MKLIVWLLAAAPLLATNYYVNPSTGNNSNAGTSTGAAWKTALYATSNSGCGDTDFLMGGIYPNDNINFSRNCTSSGVQQIVINYAGQVPIITGQNTSWFEQATISGNYVTIDGIHFEGGGEAINALMSINSNHVTIQNCVFLNNVGSFIIALTVSYPVIQNNYFDGAGSPYNGCPSSCGEGSPIYFVGVDHGLIQNNYFARGGHAAIDMDPGTQNPLNNVIVWNTFANHVRANTIENHWGGGIYMGNGNPSNTVIEGNIIGYTDEMVGFEKTCGLLELQRTIFRNNICHNTSNGGVTGAGFGTAGHAWEVVAVSYKSVSPSPPQENIRFYANNAYNIGGRGFYFYQQCDVSFPTACSASDTNLTLNKYLNNIVHMAAQGCYTLFGTSCGPSYWQFGNPQLNYYVLMGDATGNFANLTNNQTLANNIFSTVDPSGPHMPNPNLYLDVTFALNGPMSLSAIESALPTYVFGNIEADPLWTAPASGDYSLQSGSPALGAALHLAQTTGAGTNATSIPVTDTYFFSTGDGVVGGDVIQVGSVSTTVTGIADGTPGTLTVSPGITFSSGANVDFPYSGSTPDIGAIQHGTGTTVNNNPHINSWSVTGSTMTLTGVNFTSTANTISIIGGTVEANVTSVTSSGGGTSISFTVPGTILPSGGPSLVIVNNANGVSNPANLFTPNGTGILGVSKGALIQ